MTEYDSFEPGERPQMLVPNPSDDPRWNNPQIQIWRTDGARMRQTITPYMLEVNTVGVVDYLKVLGFTEVTEDLMYVLWISLPIAYRFTQTRIHLICHNVHQCGAAALGHLTDGMDFAAAHLLHLEYNYMGKSL